MAYVRHVPTAITASMLPVVLSVLQATIFTKEDVIVVVLQWLLMVIVRHLPAVCVEPAVRVAAVIGVTAFLARTGI